MVQEYTSVYVESGESFVYTIVDSSEGKMSIPLTPYFSNSFNGLQYVTIHHPNTKLRFIDRGLGGVIGVEIGETIDGDRNRT